MKVIHKFPIPLKGATSSVEMPRGAKLLHFDAQGDELFLWALVDPESATRYRTFFIVGTGHTLPEQNIHISEHVGSCLMRNGALVWHLFEVVS